MCSTYPLKIAYMSYLSTIGMSNLLHATSHRFAHMAESHIMYVQNTAHDSDISPCQVGQGWFKHTLVSLKTPHGPGENGLRGEIFRSSPLPLAVSLQPHSNDISRFCLSPKANPMPNPGPWMEFTRYHKYYLFSEPICSRRSEILNKHQNIWNNGVTAWGIPLMLTWQPFL